MLDKMMTGRPPGLLGRALEMFETVVGKANMMTEADNLSPYLCATIPLEQRKLSAVVKPSCTQDIREIVKIAARYQIALYPVSTGNNWGYGSANPVRDHNVILDLSGMNRILKVDTRLAYAVIEPGVTQGQLYDHLQALNRTTTGERLMMDPTGSGPGCSVLGNALERGYGITPYGDHFDSICGMEIVLADGSVLNTGFGHFKGARSDRLFKYGTGPYLDGLFTQSNLGIVTSIGVWLMPEPEYYEVCYFSSDDGMGPLVDAIRRLLLHRIVKGSVNLMHRNRVLTLVTRGPVADDGTPLFLDENLSRELAVKYDISEWNGVVALYGTRQEVKAARQVIKKLFLGKADKINFVSQGLLDMLERYQWLTIPLGRMMGLDLKQLIKILKPSLGLMKGRPCEVSLPTPYWRSRREMPSNGIDPAKDNCGIIWLSPVVPLTKEDTGDFIRLVTPIFNAHGFDTCITFTAVTSRAFDCTLPILYNRDDPAETRKALKCYKIALAACVENGFIPYRWGVDSMEDLVSEEDVFWKTVGKIKDSLDPDGIISPGRYSLI